MKLFAENLGVAHSNEELLILQRQFSKYDPAYVCQATIVHLKNDKTRAWIETLWDQYRVHADPHFVSDFKRQFAQRSWELYLGNTFLSRGFKLGSHDVVGPDFDLRDEKSNRSSWVEAIALEQGTGVDRVPDVRWNAIQDVPEEEMMFRITNALNTKFKKYQTELQKGIVQDNEPYVIAINRSNIGFVDPVIPLILKTLFGIGHITLRLRVDGVRQENQESFWSGRPTIAKKSGEDISMLFFMNQEYAGISAVIYSVDSILNSPREENEMGENFVIVHNPLAKNKLPDGFFPFGDEYKAVDGYVDRLKEHKDWERYSPF